jgi:hypothetical protein
MVFECVCPISMAIAAHLWSITNKNKGQSHYDGDICIGDEANIKSAIGGDESREIQVKIGEFLGELVHSKTTISDVAWKNTGAVIVDMLDKGAQIDIGDGGSWIRAGMKAPEAWARAERALKDAIYMSQAGMMSASIGSSISYDRQMGIFFIETATNIIFKCKPTEIYHDEQGRLHNEKGPSILFPGMKMYHLEGVRLSAKIIEFPHLLTAEDAKKELNAEVRRFIIKQMGYEKYLTQSGAKILDFDSDRHNGTRCLYESDEGHFMQCVCPSTGRIYWLFAPETCRKCEEVDEFLRSGLWIKGKQAVQVGRT